jgi:DtxR family Mn-dependent transcriptional regulator
MTTLTTTERILTEDVLKHIYKCELNGRRPTIESIAGVLHITRGEVSLLVDKMTQRNLILLTAHEFSLTPDGQNYALQIIRAHRLWERYLADETSFNEQEWHTQADQREHHLTPDEVEALSARLGHPTHDPHGDPIPTASGDFVPHGGVPLTMLENGSVARIVHLEDEPPMVYAQLVAEGLYPEMEIQLTETSAYRLRFRADGLEHVLAPVVARNISVIPFSAAEAIAQTRHEKLSALKIGEKGRVISLSPACRGAERRRFMDLGILPGTIISAEMISPSGDPTAYLIRRSLIGLRKEQADTINITRDLNGNGSEN